MPMLRTYAKPVEDTVTVKVPREYAACSFQVILVPCNTEPKPEVANDIHIFDKLHSDWGGTGGIDEISASLRASRHTNRTSPVW